jgi:hypothetical protein
MADSDSPRRRAARQPVAAAPAPSAPEAVSESPRQPAPVAERTTSRSSTAPGAASRDTVNSIGVARPRVRLSSSTPEAPEGERRDTTSTTATGAGESSALPEHIHERYIQVGKRFYLPSGDPAFRLHANRVSTRSENTEIIRDLIAIEAARHADQTLRVRGSARFKAEAWKQATVAGLEVTGYSPSSIERAQLVRTIARERRRGEDIRAGRSPEAAEHEEATRAPEGQGKPAAERERAVAAEGRVYRGHLVEHGPAPYQHDRHADMSYFVKLDTRSGERVLWGKDFERAIKQSLSGVAVGDDISVQHVGERPVTVTARRRGPDGNYVRQEEVSAYRNRWIIEKQEFLRERAEVARVVRDPTVDVATAIKQHPYLAGTYVELQAAKLSAPHIYPDKQDQDRFVARIRQTLADEIERGEAYSVTPAPKRARTQEPAVRDRIHERVLN